LPLPSFIALALLTLRLLVASSPIILVLPLTFCFPGLPPSNNSQTLEIQELTSQQRIGNAAAYSARIQEAMRYDKLSSSDYRLVIILLKAVREGGTHEQWKEEYQRSVNALVHQPVDEKTSHGDATNRYEQTVSHLKDLALWPWKG
jgi:hypothetical protein